MTAPVVLLRPDAGPSKGLGHLDRCLALGAAVRAIGGEAVVVAEAAVAIARTAAMELRAVPAAPRAVWDTEHLGDTRAAAAAAGASIAILDGYGPGPEYLAALRAEGLFVVAIDDLAAHPFGCHVVVNGALHAAGLGYTACGPDVAFLLGGRYVALAPELWADAKSEEAGEPNVLITVGGSDPQALLPALLERVASLPARPAVTIVVGPFAETGPAVRSAARRLGRVRVVEGPASIVPEIRRATVAVSAGGQTLYQLSRLGCPTVAFEGAANQRGQLEAFVAAGAVRAASAADIGVAVAALLADRGQRMHMSAAGRRLIDGGGALRVAAAVTALAGPGARPAAAWCDPSLATEITRAGSPHSEPMREAR